MIGCAGSHVPGCPLVVQDRMHSWLSAALYRADKHDTSESRQAVCPWMGEIGQVTLSHFAALTYEVRSGQYLAGWPKVLLAGRGAI